MAKVGPQRAADLTGRSKSTIQRAMKAGKLSYEVDNADRRVIDVSELERVFGLAPQGAEAPVAAATVENELEKAATMIETERMKMRIRMLEDQLDAARDQIDDLRDQREQWQKQAQQVLLTSQYSQKQAEELKEELKERDRRALVRRQQELQRRDTVKTEAPVKTVTEAAKPVSESRFRIGPFGRKRQAEATPVSVQLPIQPVAEVEVPKEAKPSDNIQGMWQKIRGESVANSTEAPVKDKASA